MDILGYSTAQATLWLLFMLRTLGFVFIVPLFSARSVPSQFKLALVLFLTALSFIAFSPTTSLPSIEPADFIPAAVSELVIGLMLGFMVGMIFVTFLFAGQFIGYQMGFAMVNVLDPHTQSQVSLIGEFLFALAVLTVLNLNIHHGFLWVWHESYNLAPVGAWALANFDVMPLAAMLDDFMLLSLKIAMPLITLLLLTDLALGIIARVMPQMNVFIVGMPLKIAIGLIFLSLVVLEFDPAVRQVSNTYFNHAGAFLSGLSGAGG